MEVTETKLLGVSLLEPRRFGDYRGFFAETYSRRVFNELGIEDEFVQDNHSKSSYAVLRGLHYQEEPFAQGKLVRVISGEVFDVAVDLRTDSKTCGHWVGEYLNEKPSLFNLLL